MWRDTLKALQTLHFKEQKDCPSQLSSKQMRPTLFGNLENAVGRPTAVQIQQAVSDYARSYVAGTFSTSVNVEGLPTQTFVDPVYNYKDVVQTEEQDVPQNLDPRLC